MALRKDLQILIADDMAVSRQILEQLLEQLGVTTVRTAATGTEAIESLDRQPADMIIADLHMPGLNGFELLQRLRNDRRHCRIGFVLTSGDDDNPAITEAWHNGLDRFLAKPFDQDRLVSCLEAVAGRI
ncbi:MAG: response regulator [Marinosulfonomonas sp.]